VHTDFQSVSDQIIDCARFAACSSVIDDFIGRTHCLPLICSCTVYVVTSVAAAAAVTAMMRSADPLRPRKRYSWRRKGARTIEIKLK